MHIFLTLVCSTLVVESVHDLGSELVGHRLAATLACEVDHVLHRDAFLTVRTYFSRNLECGTTDTAALYLHLRSDIVEGSLPNFECRLFLVAHFSLDGFKGLVEDLIRNRLLSIVHQMVNKL